MRFNLFPWKSIVRWLAGRHGFLDPIGLVTRLRNFGQPSEVAAPIELVRSAVEFHARGLVNARAIQHNLDWAWPFWVCRQFDPLDAAFLPRAFSLTHVNLTHRNWTAVGLPGCRAFPIVDPRGLLTPLFDGWSLDAWLLRPGGEDLMPARCRDAEQDLELASDNIAVKTTVSDAEGSLQTCTWVEMLGDAPVCRFRCTARDESEGPAWLAVALRPFNPEGISAIDDVEVTDGGKVWHVNEKVKVLLSEPPHRHAASNYAEGDVHLRIFDRPDASSVSCRVGMVSAAALYPLEPGVAREVTAGFDLRQDEEAAPLLPCGGVTAWPDALKGACQAQLPDERLQFIFDAAVRSLILMSPADTYPGPFTYRRFWFRDAVLIVNALLAAGLDETAAEVVSRWRERQSAGGYFHSQEGEWDANGEVLWALWRVRQLTDRPIADEWRRPVRKAARWIERKRTDPAGEELHAGLLPAGFSAEHLGNNDYYYWDDLWSVAGLRCAAELSEEWGEEEDAAAFRQAAADLMESIERSLERSRDIRRHPGMPASPYRRMDAGAVGSLAAGYPLQLLDPHAEGLMGTVEYLLEHCLVQGAFFQEMIHSGMNAYLTLHIAQVLMRAGDARFLPLVGAVADMASPTGQWPEAVHPQTAGGCMGDGQHVWAAAEWVMMVRNMFVREEGDHLVIGSGITAEWLAAGASLSLGPTPTPWGPVSVRIDSSPGGDAVEVLWEAEWRADPPQLLVALPGIPEKRVDAASGNVTLGWPE